MVKKRKRPATRQKNKPSGGGRNKGQLSPDQIQQVLSLIGQDQRSEAEQLFAELVRIPLAPPLLVNQLGVLAHLLGKNDTALELLQRSVALDASAPLLNNLGLVHEQLGHLAEAGRTYEQALAADPGFAEAWYNMGNVHQKLFHYPQAIEAYQEAITLRPNYPEACNNLACAQLELGRLAEAERSCIEAVRRNPSLNEAITTWKKIMERRADPDHILAAGTVMAELVRDKTVFFASLAGVLSSLGKNDEALACYQKSLAITPNSGKIHYLRSLITTYRIPAQTEEMVTAQKRATETEDRYFLNFALGKAHEDLGEFPAAFRFFKEGNDLLRTTYAYTLEADRTFINRLKTTFSAEFIARGREQGHPDGTPIFVVGMPRSGTTLVEQILASHPEVHGAGELPDIDLVFRETLRTNGDLPYPEGVRELPPSQFFEMGEKYLARLRRLSAKPRIVDKLPHNFLFLGLIRIILPQAKIIHCRRDPMDTCWSIYKNIFDTPHRYAQDLQELGRYYRLYQDLMDHWRNVLPENMHEIEYETLVLDQEKETRRLLAYCGLSWNEACLNFHRTTRKVITMSRTQVRQPLYSSSLRKWRCYERELAPLRAILDPPEQ